MLKKFIGNNYLRVIETLVDLNVIDYNEKYSSTWSTKSKPLKWGYSFSKALICCSHNKLLSKADAGLFKSL